MNVIVCWFHENTFYLLNNDNNVSCFPAIKLIVDDSNCKYCTLFTFTNTIEYIICHQIVLFIEKTSEQMLHIYDIKWKLNDVD